VWQFSALIWASGIILVLLIQLLFAHAAGKPVDWLAAVAMALIIPSAGSVGLALALRQQAQRPGKDLKP
jgi:hypothetical protein